MYRPRSVSSSYPCRRAFLPRKKRPGDGIWGFLPGKAAPWHPNPERQRDWFRSAREESSSRIETSRIEPIGPRHLRREMRPPDAEPFRRTAPQALPGAPRSAAVPASPSEPDCRVQGSIQAVFANPRSRRHAGRNLNHLLTCPFPITSYLVEVSSANANGPRQCSFCVLTPISAPKPNSPPSVKRVDAFQ